MTKETVLEINLSALKQNYHNLRSKLNPETRFLAVVKAFGYGSEAICVAKTLEKCGVDYFAVAYISEGVSLRDAGIKTPILVLHPQPINFKLAIEHKLEPSLYSFRVLQDFMSVAMEQGIQNYPVHIKFNTGLNRLGFSLDDTKKLSSLLNNETVEVVSIFSHLAASEDLKEKAFTEKQIDRFQLISNKFLQLNGVNPIRHLCNTSGVLNHPKAEFDMVRCGIGLYGFDNKNTAISELVPVMALKSVISQIHHIKKDESVGYNRAYTASKPSRIATLPLGHADGISRRYGNGCGFVTIQGQKASIVGNVCMDMIMVDVTDVVCQEGDEVIVFDSKATAEDLANAAGTISYELLTALSQRIKRVIVQ